MSVDVPGMSEADIRSTSWDIKSCPRFYIIWTPIFGHNRDKVVTSHDIRTTSNSLKGETHSRDRLPPDPESSCRHIAHIRWRNRTIDVVWCQLNSGPYFDLIADGLNCGPEHWSTLTSSLYFASLSLTLYTEI
jgi:hypothetical protein